MPTIFSLYKISVMKVFEISFLFAALVALIIVFGFPPSPSLKTGDIRFISMDGTSQDRFRIEVMVDLPAHTIIRFTDSEWNGNHFGFDENDMAWNSGKQVIPIGTIIRFRQLDTQPTVSYGNIKNGLRLSRSSEAIFAYLGSKRTPRRFLAAIGTDEKAFGTLINTGLIEGQTAIIKGGRQNYIAKLN